MIATRRTVELKATDPSPASSLARCLELGAVDLGPLDQHDTYFEVPNTRLTLREQSPGWAFVIAYDRADQPGERVSSSRIAPVADAAALRASLEAALGVSAVVTKRRRLLLWQSARIHLDEVERLGTFIELEVPAPPGSDLTAERVLLAELRTALGITDERLCAPGYASLVAPSVGL